MAAHLIICSSRVCSSGCEGKEKQAMENKNFTFHNMVPSIISEFHSGTEDGASDWSCNNIVAEQ